MLDLRATGLAPRGGCPGGRVSGEPLGRQRQGVGMLFTPKGAGCTGVVAGRGAGRSTRHSR